MGLKQIINADIVKNGVVYVRGIFIRPWQNFYYMTETQQLDAKKKQMWIIAGVAIVVIAIVLGWYFGIVVPGKEDALLAPQNLP